MINTNKLTKEFWVVYNPNDTTSIVFGTKGNSNQVSSNRPNFAEFDTEEELENFLTELTGDKDWYQNHKPEEENVT